MISVEVKQRRRDFDIDPTVADDFTCPHPVHIYTSTCVCDKKRRREKKGREQKEGKKMKQENRFLLFIHSTIQAVTLKYNESIQLTIKVFLFNIVFDPHSVKLRLWYITIHQLFISKLEP